MEAHKEKFLSIYGEYSDAIFRYFFYRLKNRDEALDLTQSVFTKVWQYISAGKEIKFPKAFVFKSAHNLFVNTIRDRKNNVSLDVLGEKGFDVAYIEDDKAEIEEQEEVIKKLDLVEEAYREVLILRFVNGLKVKEISALLNDTENNVSVKIYRGLKKLKESYE